MLIGILKQWNRVLTQLFTPRLLLSALRLKSLSSNIYHSKSELQRDVAILTLTRVASWKITRF